jgi:S-adenosylhomocysteine hydrolase
MPVLSGPVTSMLRNPALDGLRVALSDRDVVGADVLATVLGTAGVRIVTLEAGPDLVVETGPSFPATHPVPEVTGMVTTTSETAERFRTDGVPFPVVACHPARCVRLADRERGRRIIQAFARLTNKRIAGSVVTVTGYGSTARAVAATARSFGAVVGVIESDPVVGLTARLDGHDLAAHPSGVVMVVDGRPLPPLDDLPAGVFVVTPNSAAPADATEVRSGVWSVRSGEVHVVVPVVDRTFDEADLVLSVAALAVARLASDPHEPGVTAVPADIDADVARFALEVLG